MMENAIGRFTYANGESVAFTDPEEYLRCLREELPLKDVTGLRIEVLTDDPAVRKGVDDAIFDLYGLENPKPLEDYVQKSGQAQKLEMGGQI